MLLRWPDAAAVCLAAALAALLAPAPPAARAQAPVVLTVAVGQDIDSLDPRRLTLSTAASIAAHMFEPLVTIEGRGTGGLDGAPRSDPTPAGVVPRLAAAWRVADAGLTYTFLLRPGVRFQDGRLLDSSAVKANVERWANRAGPDFSRGDFAGMDLGRIETPGPETLVLRLRRPNPLFLLRVASEAVLSPRALRTRRGETPGPAPVDAGTGPYRLREWMPDDHVTLVRNPLYWGRRPFFDAVVFRIVPDADAREALLREGSVQMAAGVPAVDLPELRRDGALRVLEAPADEVIFVSLNTQWGPLRDVRVRRAMNYAVNKQALVRTLLPGLAEVADSPLPRDVVGYAPVQPGGWPYDPVKARKLLAASGYPSGFGIILGTPLGWYAEDYQVAIGVAKQLENIGVSTPTPGISASDVFVGAVPTYLRWLASPPNWAPPQLILGGWAAPYLDAGEALAQPFTRGAWPPRGRAVSYYDNPRVDALLAAARRTFDADARSALYRQAQTLIWQDAPWIFLWAERRHVVTSRRLSGVAIGPAGRWTAGHAEWK